MLKSRFRCYEIESCYIAQVVGRAQRPPAVRSWWRAMIDTWLKKRKRARSGKRGERHAPGI
jgi:hypothetical protein